ncbi:MAG: SgcJ/EcaC family oxidoreductase [marine benthic group bacterium]|jgi:uncharacterized protein (TIGR02246 family)|nr:SgcJ/EcaC family oxidoreductase [Gemmatimonadota bacterium]MCL7965854.1 SgcJ/EcaC family oxidoreductase [Gemmatimonadota bacterium]MCL7973303.1 SgcJ/EcaC family oxidoreductase [Gemmatimonadota bacterium]MCL7979787.1 SgcJ/EcaC family oxidoreductase [Gemmatimonadota bacterium]MCL7990986.1 SgcJ/EcaC family oxidoreductase [Gemmatimonadota bacterium]
MRTHALAALAGAALLGACAPPAPQTDFDPDDPQVIAAIDSIVGVSLEGARTVDADKVLSMVSETGDFTFVTGDLLLSGLETLREDFEDTYSGLESQSQEILEKRIRLLSPDIAVLTAVSEGTYTDKAGWTSEPVGIGHTIIFVRENGTWRARHVHQSIAR